MKKILISLFAATLLISANGNAQRLMTLHDCMELAVENSTKQKIQRLDNADAQINRRDALLDAFTPHISAGSGVSSNFGRAVDPETNTYISTTSFSNGYSINASITLFNGFAAINNIRIANTAVRMGRSREQQQKDEICLAVMQAYYNVIFHTELDSVLQSQVETAKKNLQLVSRQKELGQKSLPDVAQIEADLADREYQKIDNGNLLNEAFLTLKDLMLWPVDEELTVDMSLIENEYIIEDTQDSGREVTDFARTHLPAALIAKGNLENARHALHTARWQFLPSLSLGGGWSTGYFSYPGRDDYKAPSFGTQFRNNSGEYVQLNLSIPLYSRLGHFSNLSRKKNAWRRASAEYDQTMHDIETEVNRALQDRKGAMTAYIQAQKRADAQEKAYHLNRRKMEEGLISPIEFQTVSNTYLNAEAEKLNATLKYHLKNSVVKYYKGISYIEQ